MGFGIMGSVHVRLNQADRLQPTSDHCRDLVHHHPLRRHRDSLQAGTTKPVHRGSRRGYWQSTLQGYLPRHVVPSRSLGETAANDDVLDFGRIKARSLNRVLDDMTTQHRAMRIVESATKRLADGRARRRYNNCFPHVSSPQLALTSF